LGGNPTSSGGQPPYTYNWTCRYFERGYIHKETFFLDNPQLPNPALKRYLSDPVSGTISFILKVTDSNQISVFDTINITISSLSAVTLRSLEAQIHPGDSVQIEPANIIFGIAPFKYCWEPSAGLTDSAVREPYAMPVVTTHYKVTVTDSIGCVNSEIYAVLVIPTSVEKISFDYKAIVSPNPVTYNSRITLNRNISDSLCIKVYDYNGINIISDTFYQDYKIGEKMQKTGIFIFQITNRKVIVASGRLLKE
jgi:hypothetical protein